MPKYIALAEQILQHIRAESLSAGSPLPAEKRLAADLGVNHLTLRRALQLLVDQHKIHTIPSRGSYVGPRPPELSESSLIGIIFPDEELFFFRIAAALEDRMVRSGFSPLVHMTRRSPQREREILADFAAHDVAAIAAAPGDRCRDAYLELHTPVVFFDSYLADTDIPYVITNDRDGAEAAVAHLISLGHRRIAHIGSIGDETSRERHDGYINALSKAGIMIKPEYILQQDYTRQWGYLGTKRLRELPDAPTAIFCGSDVIASGVLRFLSSHSLSSPEDISVIGFSNSELSQDLQLSTVHQPIVTMAEAVWDGLTALMRGTVVPRETRLDTSLIIRKSTGPPPFVERA